MIGKNIKKCLNSVLKKWMESIDDDKIKKIIRDNTIITGGSIVSLLRGEEIKDFDVYLRKKESVLAIATYYVNKFNSTHDNINAMIKEDGDRISVYIKSNGVAGEINDESEPIQKSPEEIYPQIEDEVIESKPKFRPVYLSSNAITLSDKIQIVLRFYGEPEEIHKNYDFVHCTCCWSSWDNNLSLPSRALESIINKELYYIGSKYPLCSIIRSRKFIQRGWTINAGQYVKMALQLNTFDLLNISVLQDQLTGVDSAYFEATIAEIKRMIEGNPDFKVDNGYLFEIINRIF